MRYQQVYTSADFSALTGPSLITAILFRPDAFSGAAFSSTLPNVTIDLSTTSKTPSTLSSTFADNVGADNTVEHTGALSLSSADTGPSGGPKAFDIVINLSTPFLYDPSAGDLLLDVTNFGGGSTTQFDAVNSGDTHVNRVWATSASATTGTVDSGQAGLVTEFQFSSPVPEPSALLLLGTCIALSAGVIRRRLRR
ncbi:MAG TPA: PEP-CTERM sorting domain-containing protein [Bryobacteraceae bacterium]|nr:PEP-CTERM sorting domain-containing protein [Bryobacteraceae bacterium]